MLKRLLKDFRDTSPMMEPLCRAVRRSVNLPECVWRHLPFRGIIDFSVSGRGVKMHHFGAEVENSLFWAGFGKGWEATTLLVWERLASTANVIFDVGANTGIFALVAKAANPRARVHAFEPMSHIADRLEANARLNGFEIGVARTAVSDVDGTAQICATGAEHEYSATLERMEWMANGEIVHVDVPLLRLATHAMRIGETPDLIKIDVEGHEPKVLRGLWPAVERERRLPDILIEILNDAVACDVRTQSADKGYESFGIIEGEGVRRMPLQATPEIRNWLLLHPTSGGFGAELARLGALTHADMLAAGRPAS